MVVYGCQSKQCIIRSVIPINGNKVVVKTIDKCHNRIISEEENRQYSKDSLIRTGYYKEYFKNGNLKELGFLNKGLPDSIYFEYDQSGYKKLEYYRFQGQLSGAQYSYFPNGNIESMIFCKNDSVPLLAVYFNQNGSIKEREGSAVHLVFKPDYQNLTSGQKLGVSNVICLFPNTHGIMNIELKKNNKIIWDTTITRFRYLGRIPYYLFLKKIQAPGIYKYNANAKIIRDDRNMLIKEDSEVAVINVES